MSCGVGSHFFSFSSICDLFPNRASYEDGKLKGDIKACASNQGTQITVEDLFYNVPQRKQSFKSPNDEYQRILDVVSKYSVHNSKIGFTLLKQGEAITLRTPCNSNSEANIRIIYGNEVASELKSVEGENELLQFKMSGLTTSVNYSSKKFTFLLFINHRLVESTALKNAITQVYAAFLPKGNHPFVYLDLQIEPNNVDVNIHPTKHEVHFLYEDEIIEQIRQMFEVKLVGSNETRNFYTQSLLPGASDPLENDEDNDKSKDAKVYAKDMVRSDSKVQKLEKFFGQCILKTASTSSQPPIDSQVSSESMQLEVSRDESLNASQISSILSSRRSTDAEKKYEKCLF